MKTFYSFLFIFSATIFAFSSCSADSPLPNMLVSGENGYNYSQSKRAWVKLKKEHGNSYTYTVLELSWTGAGSTTTLEVIKGKIASRSYESYLVSDNDGTKEIIFTYSETGEEIGVHPEGAPASTIDELYKTCISRYLVVHPGANYVYFDTNEEGVMTLCGYVPKGCADDCFKGIHIVDFRWKD